VYLDYSSNAMLVNCILSENSANGSGGGMFLIESISTLANCTFSENRANVHGGGICCFSSSAILENTIVAFSTQGEAVYCWGSGTVALTCCDVYGNAGGDWVGCIAGQAGINGNFSADPLFCAPENGDFRLSCTSPCVNRYGCGQIGAFGVGCGPTSVEYTTWGRIKAMFK
jgi:predicted outer membrane repeat protein